MKKSILTFAWCFSCISVIMAQTTDPAPYCRPNYKQGASANDKIHTIRQLDGSFIHTATSFYQNSQYTFYNNEAPIVLEKESSNLFEITGQKTTQELGVFFWADTGRNDQFHDQFDLISERQRMQDNYWACTLIVNIPATIDTGLMRVRIASFHYDHGMGISACPTGYQNSASPELGETRDFMVHIVPKGTTQVMDQQTRQQKGFKLYPNPTRDRLYIYTDPANNGSAYQARITNMTGSVLSNTNIADDQSINISSLPAGVYLVTVLEAGKVMGTPQRLIIQ